MRQSWVAPALSFLIAACGSVHLRSRNQNHDTTALPTATPGTAAANHGGWAKRERPKGSIAVLFEDGRARMRSDSVHCRLRNGYLVSGSSFADALWKKSPQHNYFLTDRRSDDFELEMRMHGELHECTRNSIDGTITLEIVRDGGLVEEITRPIAGNSEDQLVDDMLTDAQHSNRVADALKGKVVVLQPATPSSTPGATFASSTMTANAPLALDSQTSILVVPLKPVRGVDKATCQLITNYMLSQLQQVKRLRTVGQGDIDAALGADKQKQTLGCSDVSCMAEIGGALGVDLVMYGEIGVLGTKYNVNVSAVRSADATVSARSSVLTEKTEDALADKVPTLVHGIIDGINTSVQAQAPAK